MGIFHCLRVCLLHTTFCKVAVLWSGDWLDVTRLTYEVTLHFNKGDDWDQTQIFWESLHWVAALHMTYNEINQIFRTYY